MLRVEIRKLTPDELALMGFRGQPQEEDVVEQSTMRRVLDVIEDNAIRSSAARNLDDSTAVRRRIIGRYERARVRDFKARMLPRRSAWDRVPTWAVWTVVGAASSMFWYGVFRVFFG